LDEKIYVTGGNIMWPDISAALEVYDPATDSWDTTRTPMSEEKYSHAMCVVDGKIYAFGGWDNSGFGPMYDDVDTYDPEMDHWLERTAMPLQLAEFGAAVVNNKVYIIGGTSTLHPFTSMNSVYEYDPASDWFHGQIAHGETIMVHPKYVAPQTETLIVNVKLHNPNQHAVMVYAMIQSDDHSYQDSLEMFDDGLHFDENAGDGIWGARCMTPPGEGMYKVSVKTDDMDSSITINSLLFDIYDRFTTIGPVESDSYQITNILFETTYQIKLLLRNKGLSEMAPGITAELSSSDSNVTNISALNNDPIDIPAGQAVETEQIFNIGTKGSPSNVLIHINLYSNGYHYWSDSLNFLATNIIESKYNLPKKYSLSQNHPNPFNPRTVISWQLAVSSDVELNVYNLLGQKVATLVSENQNAGIHSIEWDAGNLSSGVYFYMIKAGEWQDVKKMILLK
jgi:hypothetical protein